MTKPQSRERAEAFVDDVFMVKRFDEAGRPRAALSRDELVDAVAEMLKTDQPEDIIGQLFGRAAEQPKPHQVDLGGFLGQLVARQGELIRALNSNTDSLNRQVKALNKIFSVLHGHAKFLGQIGGETEGLAADVARILEVLEKSERRELLDSLSHTG